MVPSEQEKQQTIEAWRKLKGSNLDIELEILNCLSSMKLCHDRESLNRVHIILLNLVSDLALFHLQRVAVEMSDLCFGKEGKP